MPSPEYMEVQCPYCWELIEMGIDDCGENQQYIEDCHVCCRPINVHIMISDSQQVQINVYTEDDV